MLLSRYTITNMTTKQRADAAGKLNFEKHCLNKPQREGITVMITIATPKT